MVFKIVFTVLLATSTLQYVEKIDEPREPISGAAAFVNVIIASLTSLVSSAMFHTFSLAFLISSLEWASLLRGGIMMRP